jgi:pimeloyl-ACP methyl ester carboxylesterase
MFATRGEVRVAFEVFGDGDPVLLLAGNGCSSAYWPDEFCALLGARVVRYDYRDTGASTHGTHYDLDELAADALAVLDAADVEHAHLVGLSMGGFLAQRLALRHPDRVRTLTSMLSTPDYSVMLRAFSGGPAPTSRLPPPSSAWLAALAQIPADADLLLESWRLAHGSRAPFDEAFWKALFARTRADLPAGELHRQACLRARDLDLLPLLPELRVPALFLAGSEDPIFPIGHATAAAAAAPGARCVTIDGMGHALGPAHFAPVAAAIVDHMRARS